MVGRKLVKLRWKVRSLAPIITKNYDNYLESSEGTEEETDAKAASQGESDEVSQGVCYITLTKRLFNDSLANLNPNQKRRNPRSNFGPFSFQSRFSAHDDRTPASPRIPFYSIKIHSTDEAALR